MALPQVMQEELGPENAEAIFSQFDRNATAAASLAQVSV
jgi:predicted unusual protein kinase regulating ubiquinone biosynthesis (AarF/ABC1/UbiB family)